MLLMTIKRFTVNGRAYKAGDIIRVTDGQILIAQGYARTLGQDEVHGILKDYTRYAKELFTDEARGQKAEASYIQEKLI